MQELQIAREKLELLNARKKFEVKDIDNVLETKRAEMAEKRTNQLVECYLKAKSKRVSK
jgi:hypothetical protein